MHMQIHIHIHMHMHMQIHMQIHIHIHTPTHIHMHMHMQIHIHTPTHIHIHMHMHMQIHIRIHIYIYHINLYTVFHYIHPTCNLGGWATHSNYSAVRPFTRWSLTTAVIPKWRWSTEVSKTHWPSKMSKASVALFMMTEWPWIAGHPLYLWTTIYIYNYIYIYISCNPCPLDVCLNINYLSHHISSNWGVNGKTHGLGKQENCFAGYIVYVCIYSIYNILCLSHQNGKRLRCTKHE